MTDYLESVEEKHKKKWPAQDQLMNMSDGGGKHRCTQAEEKERQEGEVCLDCNNKVQDSDDVARCGLCESWRHVKCEGVSKEVYKFIGRSDTSRYTESIEKVEVE